MNQSGDLVQVASTHCHFLPTNLTIKHEMQRNGGYRACGDDAQILNTFGFAWQFFKPKSLEWK